MRVYALRCEILWTNTNPVGARHAGEDFSDAD